MEKYYDKNGTEILAGATIRMGDGSTETVAECDDGHGGTTLGVNASNEKFIRQQYGEFADLYREFYPLSEFDLREVEVVSGV